MEKKVALDIQKKRICIVCFPNYPSKETGRGIDKYSYELLNGLRKHGISPLIMEDGFVKDSLQYMVKDIRLSAEIIGIKADLYHAMSEIAAKNMVLTRKPLSILTVHDMLAFYFSSIAPFKYSYQKLCLKLVSKSVRIIATSETTKNLLTRTMKLSTEKVEVIHYGIDHQMFKPMPRKENENKTILYLGSLTRIKGFHILIKAFKLVQKRLKNVELRVGGKCKDYAIIQDVAHQPDIKQRIKFLGFIKDEELPNYYNSCDVFVWPAFSGITLSVLDAMACGAPIVINNAFDAYEYVGDAALIVEPGNVQQLADALLYILQNEDVRRMYSQKAIKRAELFSWEKMVKETLDLYNDVLNKEKSKEKKEAHLRST